jgi:hypothetical protein
MQEVKGNLAFHGSPPLIARSGLFPRATSPPLHTGFQCRQSWTIVTGELGEEEGIWGLWERRIGGRGSALPPRIHDFSWAGEAALSSRRGNTASCVLPQRLYPMCITHVSQNHFVQLPVKPWIPSAISKGCLAIPCIPLTRVWISPKVHVLGT